VCNLKKLIRLCEFIVNWIFWFKS